MILIATYRGFSHEFVLHTIMDPPLNSLALEGEILRWIGITSGSLDSVADFILPLLIDVTKVMHILLLGLTFVQCSNLLPGKMASW